MTIQTIMSRIESIQRALQSLQRQLTAESEKQASKTARITQIKRSITNSTSPSMLRSKQQEIDRLEADITRIQQKQASLSKRIADKTTDLHRQQQDLYTEQDKEQRKLLGALQRKEHEDREREAQQLAQLQTMLRATPSANPSGAAIILPPTFDAFISHASEDKDDLVRPLAEIIMNMGFSLWYDEFELRVGDSLRRKIDQGLARSRFGVVVLSPDFFSKNWPQYELDGLVAKEMTGGKVILPIWHKVSKDEVISYSPTLADRFALNTATHTIQELAAKLGEVLRGG